MKAFGIIGVVFVLFLTGCNDCEDRCCEAGPMPKPAIVKSVVVDQPKPPQKQANREHDDAMTELHSILEGVNKSRESSRERFRAWVKENPDKFREMIRQYGWREPEERQPSITAKVLALKAELGLVILSVGTNNKVKPGYRFTILRNGTYIATVQTDKVYPEMCSAIIVAQGKDKEQIARIGDHATTQPE